MTVLNKRFAKFAVDKRGSVSVIAGLVGFALVAATGGAISYSHIVETRTNHQNALDAAVLSAVTLPDGTTETERTTVAMSTYYANLGKVIDRSATDSNIPKFEVSSTRVVGRITADVTNPFPLLGRNAIAISVNAEARKQESVPLCILGLNPNNSGAFNQTGNSTLNATNCAAQFNSTNNSGMHQNGTPNARAKAFGVSGGVSGAAFQPAPITKSPKIDDPFSAMQFPAVGPCVDGESRLRGGVVTLNPGTYCGGLTVLAGSLVTLNPGVYIMKDGSLTVQSGSTVNGSEVMIAFTGANGNFPSTLMLLGGATMNVTSPVDGYYAGIQFFGARETYPKMAWPAIGGQGNEAVNLTYDGLMYFPTQAVWIFGGANVVAKSPTLVLVTQELWIDGSANLTVTKDNSRSVRGFASMPGLSYGAVLVR